MLHPRSCTFALASNYSHPLWDGNPVWYCKDLGQTMGIEVMEHLITKCRVYRLGPGASMQKTCIEAHHSMEQLMLA